MNLTLLDTHSIGVFDDIQPDSVEIQDLLGGLRGACLMKPQPPISILMKGQNLARTIFESYQWIKEFPFCASHPLTNYRQNGRIM